MGSNCSSNGAVRSPIPPKPKTPPPPTPTPSTTPTPSPTPTPTPTPPPRQNTADFASDTVDIKYDDRKDEQKIATQENDDPEPSAGDLNNNIKTSNHFFEDENFQLSSDDADIRELDAGNDDISLSEDETKSDVISLIPKPAGKQIPKLSFAAVDKHAREASYSDAETFESLRDYLTRPLGGEHKELQTARAIVAWLSQQDIDSKDYGPPSLTSPTGLLQCLREKKMTYATCYTILCRSAGLSCTLIDGIVKAASYEPGDVNAPHSPWTAVFADGYWRLVNPFWVCRALYGHSLAGWVKIEKDGQSTSQRTHASKGIARNAFQEYYFMPSPEHYVYECFPDDTRWELLPDSLTIITKKEFFELPYLLPPFFGLGLELVSERKCHIKTTDGTCKIQIKARATNGHLIALGYELFAKESENFDPKSIQRMVFNSRSNEHFIFDIRFPTKGIFKLVIYGGPFKSPLLRLCEFRITCTKEMSGMDLLPMSCGQLGWGPGPAAVEAGLFMSSRPNGLIAVPKSTKKTDVKFSIRKEFINHTTYAAILWDGKNENEDKYEKYVQTEIYKENRRLNISIQLPREGEFGLQITSIKSIERVTVCNYLLSTLVHKHEKANVKIAKEKLRESVSELETERNPQKWKGRIQECRTNLENCQKQKVDPSDEEMCTAETTIELYRYKNALRDCLIRRNLRVITITLNVVNRYKNKMAIVEDIRKVETVKEQLQELAKCSSEVSKLRGAFSFSTDETPEVFAVYRALLLLIGKSVNEVKTWEQVKDKLSDQDTVMKTLARVHATDIPETQRKKAEAELDTVNNVTTITSQQQGVSDLYEWIMTVLNIYNASRRRK